MQARHCDICERRIGDDFVYVTIVRHLKKDTHRSFDLCQTCLPYGEGKVTGNGLIRALQKLIGLDK